MPTRIQSSYDRRNRRIGTFCLFQTLRHFVDDKSPLCGFALLDEFPGDTIRSLSLNVSAIQRATKNEVFGQAVYHLEDIMVGHRFEDQVTWDADTRTAFIDYSKMSSTITRHNDAPYIQLGFLC